MKMKKAAINIRLFCCLQFVWGALWSIFASVDKQLHVYIQPRPHIQPRERKCTIRFAVLRSLPSGAGH